MCIIAMVLEGAVFGRIAEALTGKLTTHSTSFHKKILLRIIFTVIGMSVAMTFIGDVVVNVFSWGSFQQLAHQLAAQLHHRAAR
ncbi:hypothetical protein [Planococcus sp. ISL-109]|uniref:hypothetical protein n=1 Tax=Planococcus sp. ISL-109 TaxID=2819166 RepID=UPI001BE87516|nr:hypothetical protein [Planococcus sp. ISL-109]MBT2583441.1 hypothetical protein [Planococcus sp. ISL-109]